MVTVQEFIQAIRKLPAYEPIDDGRVWYKTQKEHWLGWLSEYHQEKAAAVRRHVPWEVLREALWP